MLNPLARSITLTIYIKYLGKVIVMCDHVGNKLTDEEKLLKEKARQSLKKNKTPTYTPEDEGGVMSGPLSKNDMEQQAEEQDEQQSK